MTVSRLDQLVEPPVVGRSYLVPTVRYQWYDTLADWPVHGPKHSDAEIIGFTPEHYHLDLRFITKRLWRKAEGRGCMPEVVFQASPLSRRGRDVETEPHPAPAWKRMRCQREAPSVEGFRRAAAWIVRLESAYAGRLCGRDAAGRLICPHKGADLTTLPPDARGVVTCPLHGLRIDAARGVVLGPAALTMADAHPPVSVAERVRDQPRRLRQRPETSREVSC